MSCLSLSGAAYLARTRILSQGIFKSTFQNEAKFSSNTEHDVSTLGHFWLLKRNCETEQVTASREHINITCGDMLNLMEHSVKYVQYELSETG